MSLLEVHKLTKRYGEEAAVEDLSFVLEQRTATALIGPNGAGKTTTLSMLAGLLQPTSGSIHWGDGSGMGFLPQYPTFFPWLTALEFTEMAARLSGVDAKSVRRQAERTLEFVGLGSAMRKKTGAFSGGMKQRLGLAQAIVHQPKLLLLDEPVSALDPAGRREVMDLLKSLQKETTILYSTHILNDAEEMTDQLLFMKDGRLVEHGSLEEVRSRHADSRIRVRFTSTGEARAFVEKAPWKIQQNGNAVYISVKDGHPALPQVMAYFAANSEGVRGVEHQTATLEEIFLKVAGNG